MKQKPKKKPDPKRSAAAKQGHARRYLRRNYTTIMLHTYYQRIGLPTSLLNPLIGQR